MTNVSANAGYPNEIIAAQRVFFNQNWGHSYQILLTISTQVIGFSFAGITRQFLVWPAAMIWPGALVNAALFNTLHRNYRKSTSKHISRERFFCFAMLASFLWFWFPGYIFTALSIFNWVCWIAPNNIVVNQLFGYTTGLGMGFLTFDWTMISYIGSPLVVPVCFPFMPIKSSSDVSFYSGGLKSTLSSVLSSLCGFSHPFCIVSSILFFCYSLRALTVSNRQKCLLR